MVLLKTLIKPFTFASKYFSVFPKYEFSHLISMLVSQMTVRNPRCVFLIRLLFIFEPKNAPFSGSFCLILFTTRAEVNTRNNKNQISLGNPLGSY